MTLAESQIDELRNEMHLAGRAHDVVPLLALNDYPDALDAIPRIPPQNLRQARLDTRHHPRDFACHVGLSADRTFMIEQDAVRGVNSIGFARVDRNPVSVELGDAVRRTRVNRSRLLGRRFLHQSVDFIGLRLLHAPNDVR